MSALVEYENALCRRTGLAAVRTERLSSRGNIEKVSPIPFAEASLGLHLPFASEVLRSELREDCSLNPAMPSCPPAVLLEKNTVSNP